MIRIIKANSTKAIDYIEPLLLKSDDYPDVSVLAEELRNVLVKSPDRACFILALELGETTVEEPEVVMFALGVVPPGRDYLWVTQTWASSKLQGRTVQDQVFSKLICWAKARELKQIRMETQRSAEAFARRWGFKQLSVVMSFDLENQLEELVQLGQAVKEQGNVDEQRDQPGRIDPGVCNSEHADQPAEERSEQRPVHDRDNGPGVQHANAGRGPDSSSGQPATGDSERPERKALGGD